MADSSMCSAGAAVYRSALTGGAAIKDSIFSGNIAKQHGGAIYDQDTTAASSIAGNSFDGNQSPQGAAILIRQGATTIGQNLGLPLTDVASVTYADEGSADEYDSETSTTGGSEGGSSGASVDGSGAAMSDAGSDGA